jgi:hypothetical protein
VGEFVTAVQNRDLDGLFCRMAGVAEAEELGATPEERRAGFEAWALERYAAYADGRDEGLVELDGSGIALVKLFALGRGAFQLFGQPVAAGEGARTLESEVRFGYAAVDLSRFSPGTIVYVCGAPVGRVHPLRIPATSGEVTADVLDVVRLQWTLVRSEGGSGCPAGWAVSSVEPVEGSAVTTELTWVF